MSTNLIDGLVFGLSISFIIIGLRVLMLGNFLLELLLVVVIGLILASAQYALDRFRKRRSPPSLSSPAEPVLPPSQAPPPQSPDIGWDDQKKSDQE